MGGRGSGRILRWDKKTILEECRAIDVRAWQRRGLLSVGTRFAWLWSSGEVQKGDIRVHVADRQVTLSYRWRQKGGDWLDIDDPIALVGAVCHLGGERVYLRCPGCEKKALKLYLASIYFRCRRCCGLPYASQQETLLDRATRKALKLRRKLKDEGEIGDVLFRPKGMHAETFERLRNKVEMQDEIASLVLAARASAFGEWV